MRTVSSRSVTNVAPLSPRAQFEAHLTRRHALRLIGGMSVATAGLLSLNSARALAQEASGTPLPMVTPEIGPQADGSTRYRVQVAEMNMEEAYEFHAFFPGEMTVNEGDSVWFDFGMGGFHTVSFLSGGEEPPIWIEAPGGATPEAEAEPKLIINPSVQWEQGAATYDGTGYLNSGIDVFRDPSTPYVVTFTTAGEYEYVCIIHSLVMKAKLIVQAAGSEPAHTQEEYDAISQEEKAALAAMVEPELAKYAEATSTENADGTTSWGVVVGAGGETELRIQRFLPAELEIKVGDSVTWTNQAYGEPHTVSFLGAGEAPPEDITVEIGADGMPMFVQSPLTLFEAGGDVWSGTGWVNSGFMGFHKLEGSPIEYTLTFDTPGEYIPFCALHGDSEGNGMAAKLTVLPA